MTTIRQAAFALLAIVPLAANSTPIINATGLASPDVVVDFETIVLAAGTVLTNQYASEGVTFSPNVIYDPQTCPFPGFGGAHCAGNFPPTVNPFNIEFSSVVSAAAFGFATNQAMTTVSAYLGNTLIEQFVQATNFSTPGTAFLGFSGIFFDRIEILVSSNLAVFDNIQYITAVPEPGTLALLGIGLFGMGLARRKQKV